MSTLSDHASVNKTIERIDDVARSGTVSMAVRIYRAGSPTPAAPVVFHLHAGAFVAGSLASGGAIANLLAEAGATVISAEYPLAPRYAFPQPLEALYGVLCGLRRSKWLHKKSPLFVAGEEAGGNLAAGLALMARDQHAPELAGQILLSPMLDPCMATCSVRAAEAGAVGCRWADGWHDYLKFPGNAAHPYAAPVNSSRLTGVAPALILTADDDPLRDESLSYANRLRESGVTVEQHVLPGPTGWPCAFHAPAHASWATTVRDCFADFFARTLGLFQRGPALHPTYA